MPKQYTRKLMAFARKTVDKATYKKIKAMKEEKEQALEYSIISAFKKRQAELEDSIKILKQRKDTFLPEAKLCLLAGKIAMLRATFHEDEFKKLNKFIKEIKEEIKNV